MSETTQSEISINNPLKIILKKDYATKFEIIKNFVTIITISNNIKLTDLETTVLSYFIEKGNVSENTKLEVVEKLGTSVQTINNQISKFRKLNLVTKKNGLHKELVRSFTNPTLIYLKYGTFN